MHKSLIPPILLIWALLVGLPLLSQPLPKSVRDDGDILKPTENRQIEQLLNSIYDDKGFDFRLVTIDSLAGRSVRETSLDKADEIGLKGPGYKISGLIFISSKEKKLSLEFSPALEWKVPESENLYIKRELINAFRSGNFAQGIIDAFLRINFLAGESKWAVDFDSFDDLKSKISIASGRIVRMKIQTVTKEFPQEKLTDDQFADSNFIYVRASDNKLVKLHFPKYSLGQIQDLIVQREGIVFGRVVEVNPLDLNFLGWEVE